MGLFLGLGLVAAAFVVDDIQNGGYQRTMRALERKYGRPTAEEREKIEKLYNDVVYHRFWEKDEEVVITVRELEKITKAYEAAGVPMPGKSAIRDVCVLEARRRGFVFKGVYRNTYFKGPIKDPSNVVHLGIVDLWEKK